MTTILLLITAVFAVVSWNNLKHGLLLLVALLPSYLLRTTIAGVPTTLLELLVLTLVAVWLIQNRTRLKKIFALDPMWRAPIALILLAATIGIFLSPNTFSALGIWKAYFIEPLLIFFLTKDLLGQKTISKEDIFVSLGVSALMVSTVAIAQWLLQAGIPAPWDIERRVTSVFPYPNATGLFLGPMVILSLYSISAQKKRAHNIFWSAVLILSMIATTMAQTEAALVAIVATIFIASILTKRLRTQTIILSALLALVLLLSPARGPLVEKLTLQDTSGQVRISQWTETLELLKDNTFFGTGLAGYKDVLVPYHQASHIEIFEYPHNILLNTWVELGLLGVFGTLLLIWRLTKVAAKEFVKEPAAHIALLVMIEMGIHGLVDVPYFKNDLALLTWILLAIIYFTYGRSRKHS